MARNENQRAAQLNYGHVFQRDVSSISDMSWPFQDAETPSHEDADPLAKILRPSQAST